MKKFVLVVALLIGCFFVVSCHSSYDEPGEEKELLMGQLVVDEETGEEYIEPFYAK